MDRLLFTVLRGSLGHVPIPARLVDDTPQSPDEMVPSCGASRWTRMCSIGSGADNVVVGKRQYQCLGVLSAASLSTRAISPDPKKRLSPSEVSSLHKLHKLHITQFDLNAVYIS